MKAQGFDGISFAIPIDTAAIIIQQLLKNKRVVRPYVGLKMLNIVGQRFEKGRRGGLEREDDGYVLITDIVPNSPAEKAGLRRLIYILLL